MSVLADKYSKQFGIPAERIIVSKTLLTRLLGVDSKTIDAWARDAPALPCLVRGQQKPNRVEWVYDLKAVIEWVRDRAFRSGRLEATGELPKSAMIDPETGKSVDVPDHLITTEEAIRRKEIVRWQDEQLDFDLKQKNVLYMDQAEAVLGDVCARISERLGLMRSEMVATMKRAGIGEVAAAEMVDDHIFEMIEMLNKADVSVDPAVDDDEDDYGSGDEDTEPTA